LSTYDFFSGSTGSTECSTQYSHMGTPESPGSLDSNLDNIATPVSSGWDSFLLSEPTNPIYLSRTSPLGGCSNNAIRLNSFNDSYYGGSFTPEIARMKTDFIAGEVFVFDFAMILRNPMGHGSQLPFFKVQILDQNNQVIQERCIVADPNGCVVYDP